MTTISLHDKEINFPEDWSEIKLSQFIQFMKWLNSRPEKFDFEFEEIIYNLSLIRIFSLSEISDEEINSLDINEIGPLMQSFDKFIGNIPETTVKDYIMIDGILYSFKDLDSLSIGEYISYQQYLQVSQDKLDVVPDLLAIICRPAKKEFNTEFQKDVYILDPFKAEDIKARRKVMENAPALDLMALANFFLTGSQGLTNSLKASSVEK